MARRAAVAAPKAQPPRVSLVSSAVIVTETDDRWEAGFAYTPESCASAGISDPCAVEARTIADNEDAVEFEPFEVWAGFKCSTFGFQASDYDRRAREALEACESAQIEAELWKGTYAQDGDRPNNFLNHLTNSDRVSDGNEEPVEALALLEQALAECGCGQQGMIHAPVSVVTLWSSLNLLRREANRIYTIRDTIVVPGAGYDGSGPGGLAPADGALHAYATPMVQVRLGRAVTITPNPEDDDALAQATDRETNTVEFRAARVAAATFDPCCHFVAAIDAPLPDVGGAS